MELDKRNYTDFADENAFPGKISDNKEYHFPALFNVDSNENTRKWEIKIRLVKGNEKKYVIDWDVMLDDTVPIKKKYLSNSDLPNGTIAQVWVEAGVITGKQTRYAPSYPKIKNEGKKNERNQFEQALVDARTLYLKKLENGFRLEKDLHKKSTKKHKKYFPMLVRKYQDEKKHLEYPMLVQPKLDGARCIAYLDKHPDKNPTFKDVVMYTRQKKDYIGFDTIKKDLLQVLRDMYDLDNDESIYVDGELYKHGMSLQTISGAVRNPKRDDMPKYKGIQYWVFDIFYPSTLALTFEDRMEYLGDFFNSVDDSKHIVETPTHEIKTEAAMNKLYNDYLQKKYEGVILRNTNSLYLTHPTKNSTSIRSKFVLKRKASFTDEFEVIGFTQGTKGKDKGAIIWILKTHNTNKTFNSTPKNITYEERYKLFKSANANNKQGFDNKYKGRMMTIEYEDLSKDKVPLRAKSVGFREHI